MLNSKLWVVSFMATALSACVVVPRHQVAVVEPVGAPVGEVEVDAAPPPPQVEVVPAVPFAGAVWIGGYWGWRGGRHVWIGGHYEAGRPGYHWEPHRWVAVGGHWRLRGGFWARG
jgi:hypothetical protein